MFNTVDPNFNISAGEFKPFSTFGYAIGSQPSNDYKGLTMAMDALGNINSKRDWGHAKDYVYAMWKMLQINKPDDFVIGTGKVHSVKDFIKIAFKRVNLDYKKFIKIDKKLFRPNDKVILRADFRQAKFKLKRKPKITFESLVNEMVDYDINN